MILKNFISNTNILRDLDYISANIQDSSTEFLTKNSDEICNALKSRIDTFSSQDICRKLVLDKLASDNPAFVSNTLFVSLDEIKPDKDSLDRILDFFDHCGEGYSYWKVADQGLTLYLIKYGDKEIAKYVLTQLSDFKFKGTKFVVSRSIDLENLSVYEKTLIGKPKQQKRFSSRERIFIKKTPSGLVALWYQNKSSWSEPDAGSFMFSNGKEVCWHVFFKESLCIKDVTSIKRTKLSRQELEDLYSMLETHGCSREKINWRKLKLIFEK